VTTAKADAVTLPAAEAQDDIAALQANDPRWSGSTHKQARTQAMAASKARKEAAPAAAPAPPPIPTPEQAASVAAYQSAPADEDPTPQAKPDKAETAAIHPAAPVKPAAAAAEDAADNGRILRAVTMRSGPKKGAAPIGTIPAKAGVQVISCKSWCEIVYKGKHGFIYKSFLQRG
jgi:hypothetical protein